MAKFRAVKFYVKRRQTQRARISCKNLRRNSAAKSSFKTRQKSSKDQKAAAAKSSRWNSARKFLRAELLCMRGGIWTRGKFSEL